MFLWDGATLEEVSAQRGAWIEDSIRVFDGDFTNPDDRLKIVDTCLGLWATAYYTYLELKGGSRAESDDTSAPSRSALHARSQVRSPVSSPVRWWNLPSCGTSSRVSWRASAGSSSENAPSFKRQRSQELRKRQRSQELRMDASTTIYDRVSAHKEDVFPPAYFGELVDLLEECLRARRIVPVLRSDDAHRQWSNAPAAAPASAGEHEQEPILVADKASLT